MNSQEKGIGFYENAAYLFLFFLLILLFSTAATHENFALSANKRFGTTTFILSTARDACFSTPEGRNRHQKVEEISKMCIGLSSDNYRDRTLQSSSTLQDNRARYTPILLLLLLLLLLLGLPSELQCRSVLNIPNGNPQPRKLKHELYMHKLYLLSVPISGLVCSNPTYIYIPGTVLLHIPSH